MVEVKLDSRRDYELYIKAEVAKLQVSNKFKKIIREMCMTSFDNGIKLTQDKLKVMVMEHS